MSNTAKVSLIIPIYNVEKYLAACLDSILRQSYKNLEIICIDDGSTDASYSISKKFAEKDERIKLFKYENGGLSVARNRGLEKATGEYIQFIDSDDLLPDNCLGEIISLIERHNLDVCLGNATALFDGIEKTQELEDKYQYVRPVELYNEVKTGTIIFSQLIKTHYHPSACLYIFRKSLIAGLKFYPNIYHEDNIFTTQLLSSTKARRVMVAPVELYVRRVRPDSITTQQPNTRHVEGLLKGFDVLLHDYKSNVQRDEVYQDALRTYLSRLIIRAARVYSKTQNRNILKQTLFKFSLLLACIKYPLILLRLRTIYNVIFT